MEMIRTEIVYRKRPHYRVALKSTCRTVASLRFVMNQADLVIAKKETLSHKREDVDGKVRDASRVDSLVSHFFFNFFTTRTKKNCGERKQEAPQQ